MKRYVQTAWCQSAKERLVATAAETKPSKGLQEGLKSSPKHPETRKENGRGLLISIRYRLISFPESARRMDILHRITVAQLNDVVQEKLALYIEASRKGKLEVVPGGGGRYGKVKDS